MTSKKQFTLSCDDFKIEEITLTYAQYKDQKSRDIVRRKFALKYSVPVHYFRLRENRKYKFSHKNGRFFYDD
jgi:hypothetical protein